MEVTGRRQLTNRQLLLLLICMTTVIGGLGVIAGPEARLSSLLVFLPALTAGLGSVGQTLFAAVWSTLAVSASVTEHPEPHAADNILIVCLAVIFGVIAAFACNRRLLREAQINRLRSTATTLQRHILRPLPQHGALVEVDGVYEPVHEDRLVGGDIYDVAGTEFGTRVLIGDVQGKGIAALGAGIAVIGSFREAAHREKTLTGLVAALEAATVRHNADAAHDGEPERFVTALVLGFDACGEVSAVDCGHLPAFLIGVGGASPVRLAESGVPLGLAELVNVPRCEQRFAFPPDSTLVLYTDGLSEARNNDGSFYPLEQRLGLFAALTPRGLARALREDVREFSPRRQDDLAILVVRRAQEVV